MRILPDRSRLSRIDVAKIIMETEAGLERNAIAHGGFEMAGGLGQTVVPALEGADQLHDSLHIRRESDVCLMK